MARTGEEKIERDDYGKKGREPEGVVEVEETHVCTGTVRQRSSARLEKCVRSSPQTVCQFARSSRHMQRCTISSRVSMNT
jgi:hypothetical protein